MRLARFFTLGLVASLAACGTTKPSELRRNPNLPRHDENFHDGSSALLLKYDANHDGTLTRGELIAGLKKEFAALHPNHAGCLTPHQVNAINRVRIAADKSAATLLEDWNQDGCLDFREYSAAAYSLFDELDRNGDGKITPDEFNPRRASPAPQNRRMPMERRRRGDPDGLMDAPQNGPDGR